MSNTTSQRPTIMKRVFAYGVRNIALAAISSLCAFTAAPASATVIWELNPDKLNAPAGSTTLAYTSEGYTITASGYDNNGGIGTATELFYKSVGPFNGASETGLGVANTRNHELRRGSTASNPFDFIQFDLTSILSAGATSGAISVASVQSGESFTLWGSNVAGTLGTQLVTYGTDLTFESLPDFGQYDYYSIAVATGGGVIPFAISAEFPAVPEMSALLPIVGLMVAVGSTHALRRRKMAKASLV